MPRVPGALRRRSAACLLSVAWDATWLGSAWEAAFGLVPILGAGWFSMRLSHGRLLPPSADGWL